MLLIDYRILLRLFTLIRFFVRFLFYFYSEGGWKESARASACVCACMCVRVCVCVRACVRACGYGCVSGWVGA